MNTFDCDSLERDAEYPLVFAARHQSDEIRRKSSSGGMFHALAEWVISRDGIVYGCTFDNDHRAVHVRCETIEDCERCMGTKYSQSNMGRIIPMIEDDLARDRPVLFTGTPCQCDAVRHACKNEERLLTADFVCGGVPSPELFQMHLGFLEYQLGDSIVSYEHRPKEGRGWGHWEKVTTSSGRTFQSNALSESWKRIFASKLSLRPCCYSCPYATTPRASDVTIGDFWGIENTPLAAMDDKMGVSVVLANSAKGFKTLKESRLELHASSSDAALPGNPMLATPIKARGNRVKFWEDFFIDDYREMLVAKGYLRSDARQLAANTKRSLRSILKLPLSRS